MENLYQNNIEEHRKKAYNNFSSIIGYLLHNPFVIFSCIDVSRELMARRIAI
jgi:hypothetical protein